MCRPGDDIAHPTADSFLPEAIRVPGGVARRLVPALQAGAQVVQCTGGEGAVM